ncbi:MAG TPA: ATP-binding protein [Rhodocyclaceae bacterium]|nr:ATP-binding protein [Rhodocyclaceae bacterium]
MRLEEIFASRVSGYALAFVAIGVAIALRIVFAEMANIQIEYFFYLIAILIVARFFGLRAGLLAVGLAVVASTVPFWTTPVPVSFDTVSDESLHTLLFALVGICICLGYHSMHRARVALQAQAQRSHHLESQLTEEVGNRLVAQEQMRVQRDWFETTLANIGDAIVVTDAAGRIVLMNKAAAHLTGLRHEEMEGRLFETIFNIVDEKAHSPIEGQVARAIESGFIQAPDGRSVLIDAHGTQHPIEESAVPISGSDGNISGVVIVLRDISARHEADAEREGLLSELRDADRLKDEFLALLAHELRNPLAPIRSAIDIVRMGDKAAVGNACDILQRQVGNMSRLVDDLLQVSRITHNHLELRKVPTDLAPVLRQAVEMSRPMIEGKSHRFVEEIPRYPMPIDADPTRLAQLFANLLNNAAKFTDPGGEISLSVECNVDHVVVAVSDNGVGIPRGMEEKIFQLFTQLDAGTARTQGGLGIGLTLVQRIAHMHGGVVRVARTVDPGTTFLVELPLSKRTQTVVEQPNIHVPNLAGSLSLRVLVVDDNQDAAESMAVLLGMLGSRAHVCHDGIAAVEAVSQFHPDVILLDIGLPLLDGYGAAARIRQQPEGRDVMLIALSGYGRDDDRRRSKAAGFNHHLVKPVAPDTLINLLSPLAVHHA